MRLGERRMMSHERKGIKGRGHAGHNKGLRSIHETKKWQVTGECRKYSLRISIIYAYPPPGLKKKLQSKFKRYDIRRTCSKHGG